MKESMQRKE